MHARVVALLVSLACTLPSAARAQSVPDGLEDLCAAKISADFFPDMRAAAIEARRELCVRGGDEEQVLSAFRTFIAEQLEARPFAGFGGFTTGDPAASVRDPLDAAWNAVTSEPPAAPTFGQTLDDLEVEVGGVIFRAADEAGCTAKAREVAPESDAECEVAIDEFRALYNYAQAAFAAPGALAFERATNALSGEWERYLDESRAQTPLELLINTAAFRKGETETSGFRMPPEQQWIVLHPSLVVENVADAVDGEETMTALMLELVGFDRWRTSRWYVPSGGSVVAVYSDRPGVSDAGYGVALHFQSLYTLGFTRHDGDDGVFVSFDLLKLIQDKQKVLEAYAP